MYLRCVNASYIKPLCYVNVRRKSWTGHSLDHPIARARQCGDGADGWRKLHCEYYDQLNRLTNGEFKFGAKKQRNLRGRGCIFNSEWARTFPGIRASNQSAAKAYSVTCNTHVGIGHDGRHDVKRHIERAAHIAKAQSRLGSINRFVAAGCEIDKVTSAEISFCSLPSPTCRCNGRWRRVWVASEEDVVYHSTSCAPWWWKNTDYRFSRFFVRSVPLFRSLMFTPMKRGMPK